MNDTPTGRITRDEYRDLINRGATIEIKSPEEWRTQRVLILEPYLLVQGVIVEGAQEVHSSFNPNGEMISEGFTKDLEAFSKFSHLRARFNEEERARFVEDNVE